MSELLVIKVAHVVLVLSWLAILSHKRWGGVYRWYVGFTESHRKVEWLREQLGHLSVYGSVVAAFLGFSKESPPLYAFGAIWFVVLTYFSYSMNNTLEELDKRDT